MGIDPAQKAEQRGKRSGSWHPAVLVCFCPFPAALAVAPNLQHPSPASGSVPQMDEQCQSQQKAKQVAFESSSCPPRRNCSSSAGAGVCSCIINANDTDGGLFITGQLPVLAERV